MKSPTHNLQTLFNSSIYWHFFYYLIFFVSFLIGHYVVISFVAFFHFLLNHEFNTIEDWTFKYSWEIIIFTRSIAFYFALKSFTIINQYEFSFSKFFLKTMRWPRRNHFIFVLYLGLSIIFLGGPKFTIPEDHHLPLGMIFLSYLGTAFLYFSEFFFLAILSEVFPLKTKKEFFIFTICFPLLFYVGLYISIPYTKQLDFFLVIHLLTCLIFQRLSDKGLTQALVYILLLVAPMGAALGQDPIWGELFAIFRFKKELPLHICLFLWFTAYVYLIYTEKEFTLKKDKI